MILGLDARELVPGKYTGIRRHLENLVAGLRVHRPEWQIALFINQHCEKPDLGPRAAYYQAPERATWFWDQFVLRRLLRETRADCLYSPYYKTCLLAPCPVILTIHDLAELALPEYRLRNGAFHTRLLRLLCRLYGRRAARITCDSAFTRNELTRIFPGMEQKAAVQYLDVDTSASAPVEAGAVLQRYRIQKPYLLYVGNFNPHKNVAALLDVFLTLRRRPGMTCGLVLAGAPDQGSAALQSRARESGQPVCFTGYVDAPHLPAIYQQAELLVLPSRYEGFGYPVAEAMQSGTPVCCSRAASLPEVAGDAAVYFDPDDNAGMEAAILEVLQNTARRRELVARGWEQVQKFRGGNFARSFASLVETVVRR